MDSAGLSAEFPVWTFKGLTGIALRSLGASTRGVDAVRCSRSRFCRSDAEPAVAIATA
jgi:hypothetical protein